MGNHHNPKSHKRMRRDTSHYWSELPLDLLCSVFERLGFADFQRAKSVCSSWYSASRQSMPKNHIPWLILFPEDNKNSCTLFSPEQKDKLYKTQDLGVKFTKSVCKATYGSWLLMEYPQYNLYIVNLFSHERINLPPMESQLGMTKIGRTSYGWFYISNDNKRMECKCIAIRSPVFWIDEKTKEFIVLWGLASCCVVSATKGDTSWNQIPETSYCCDMVYKDHKLYFLSYTGSFKILDFSGEIRQQTIQGGKLVNISELGPFPFQSSDLWHVVERKLVVTITGDVLKVERIIRRGSSYRCSFRIYKVYSSGFFKEYERVDSLGDEAMLLDVGITVLADKVKGLNRSSIYFSRNPIYFSRSHRKNTNDILQIFSLETQRMKRLHKFDFSSVQLSRARWFLPTQA